MSLRSAPQRKALCPLELKWAEEQRARLNLVIKPHFFLLPHKLKDLAYLYHLPNSTIKQLCFIFWAQNEGSKEGAIKDYQKMVKHAKDSPFMAERLMILYKQKTEKIEILRHLALEPAQFLRRAIFDCFFTSDPYKSSIPNVLKRFDEQKLKKISTSLALLEKHGQSQKDYRLVLDKGKEGEILCVFLPLIASISDDALQTIFISLLYLGIQGNALNQESYQANAAYDPIYQERIKEFIRCFRCVSQLQSVQKHIKEELSSMMLWGVKNSENAHFFRAFILDMEEQYKILIERLQKMNYSEPHELTERLLKCKADLYQLAYKKLNPKIQPPNFSENITLNEIKTKLLTHPVFLRKNPRFYQALIDFFNSIVVSLRLKMDNLLKNNNSGHYRFFKGTNLEQESRVFIEKAAYALNINPIS